MGPNETSIVNNESTHMYHRIDRKDKDDGYGK